MNNEKGFLLYANYSEKIDYATLAVCCALSIKTNLIHNDVTVVLDKKTKEQLLKKYSEDIVNVAFDNIIVTNKSYQTSNRKHSDTPWDSFFSEFNNKHRILTYLHSPYKETILIDTDFIVMNNEFDLIWGCSEDFLMNRNAVDLQGKKLDDSDLYISQTGIPLYWATLVYFKKCEFSKAFFDLVSYIKEEYNYFRFLYGFPEGFYRNDFAFSIAAHIMNGYEYGGQKPFPNDTIITSYQEDSIAHIKDSKEIIFLSTNMNEKWKSVLVNTKGMNVHVMNKIDFIKRSKDFIEYCMEKL